MSDFISRNKPDWDELESLVKQARKSIRSMGPQQRRRLDVLYRRTTVHLSQVATRTTDAQLIAYLNGLTAAAHSLIYLPPRQSMWRGVTRFFYEGFARLIARNWRYHTVSLLLVLGGATLAYFASLHDTLAAYALLPAGDVRQPGSTKEQLLEVLRHGRDESGGFKFLFASFLFSHNLKVGFLAMATGVLAGIPTTLLMLYNGMILGSFVAVHHRAGIDAEMWAWILPHGVTEIGAIVLCGGIGLSLGRAVVAPGPVPRMESMRRAGIEAGLMSIGVAAMLVLAAVIESYLRQSHLSTEARLLFASATALFWVLYITHGFLRERASRSTANPMLQAPTNSAEQAAVPQSIPTSAVMKIIALLLLPLVAAGPAVADKPTARTDEIIAMEKIADYALVPPTLNTSPLPEYDYDKLDYGMTIGIERTPGGRLWACWVAGGDSPKAFFVLATSDDDGETWSKPRLVVDAHDPDLPAERSVLVGNLWADPLGRLWLIFDQSMDMFDGRAGVWVAVCENPDAKEPSWSKPRRIWHGVTLNKPTVLSTGEWMLPISLDQRPGFRTFKGCFQELDPLRGANVFVSTDQGATWQRRGRVKFPNPDWHEHMIVERKDGTLWMLARTAKGIMQSTSSDGGKTWSAPTSPAIKHPAARFHVRRLASGRILLIKHGKTIDTHEGRSMLTAWLSDDEGLTWRGGLMLDERTGISYPDGFQAPDGTVYISYDRNRSTDGEILLARFTEEDILAKKLVGPKSKLKMLISRPLGRQLPSP